MATAFTAEARNVGHEGICDKGTDSGPLSDEGDDIVVTMHEFVLEHCQDPPPYPTPARRASQARKVPLNNEYLPV